MNVGWLASPEGKEFDDEELDKIYGIQKGWELLSYGEAQKEQEQGRETEAIL